ncbi:BET1-like protein [Babylonia areolata]|uniref:BET1-like protein n=1 Tax=Babylonia areolata TaxID=304850 RepID=UPI003FD26D16
MANWGTSRNGFVSEEEVLENQNQHKIESLASKVSLLKGIAIELEADSKKSPTFVDGVLTTLGSAEGLLSGSMHRVSHMLNTTHSNRRLMCYLIAALVGLFIIFHYILSHFTL